MPPKVTGWELLRMGKGKSHWYKNFKPPKKGDFVIKLDSPLAREHEHMQALRAALQHVTGRELDARTPGRFWNALAEMTSGYSQEPATILERTFPVKCDEMVVVTGIRFWSLCEHHLLPFEGTAVVGYIPGKRIVGLSKLARLVECFARRLQVQERLTQEIASAIQKHLKPRGVGVLVKARHTCMAMRGVRSDGRMVTSALLGAMRRNPSARAEFLELARSEVGGGHA